DRQDVRHRAEQAGFAAERGAGAVAPAAMKGKPHSDGADEQQMRNRENDAKRDGQAVATGARRLDVDRDRIRHAPIISRVVLRGVHRLNRDQSGATKTRNHEITWIYFVSSCLRGNPRGTDSQGQATSCARMRAMRIALLLAALGSLLA